MAEVNTKYSAQQTLLPKYINVQLNAKFILFLLIPHTSYLKPHSGMVFTSSPPMINNDPDEQVKTSPGPRMARVVERNINALLERSKQEEKRRNVEETIADNVTKFTGSMLFVYIHLALFGVWIIWNIGLLGLKPFDPSFVVLAMFASVEAIFLSTFVLISQNRMNAQADKRAELDLQVSLLTEHEVTRLITMVTAMAKKMNIEEAYDKEIDELAKDVHPVKVMDTMEKIKRQREEQ